MLVASQRNQRQPTPPWAYFVAPAIAALCLIVTIVWGEHYGLGLRDPDGIIGRRIVFIFLLIGAFWALDVIPRAIKRDGEHGFASRLVAVARERWPMRRVIFVLGSIVAFYVTYLCYRNVKSYLPLARPELFDTQLADIERSIFGTDPAVLMHDLLGTGLAAHVLSAVYLLFLTFVPLSVGATLVWSTDRASALWWVSVLSIAWILGAASYFLIPSMGPAFAEPYLFTQLPDTPTGSLQEALLQTRNTFLASPTGSGELQSIAAFASLHIGIVFAGALVAQLLRAPRLLRVGMWVYLALTWMATLYFGWHYLIDDLAGFVIGFLSVYLGALLTGWRIERRSPSRALQVQSA
jgi:PAP2 superfamily